MSNINCKHIIILSTLIYRMIRMISCRPTSMRRLLHVYRNYI